MHAWIVCAHPHVCVCVCVCVCAGVCMRVRVCEHGDPTFKVLNTLYFSILSSSFYLHKLLSFIDNDILVKIKCVFCLFVIIHNYCHCWCYNVCLSVTFIVSLFSFVLNNNKKLLFGSWYWYSGTGTVVAVVVLNQLQPSQNIFCQTCKIVKL